MITHLPHQLGGKRASGAPPRQPNTAGVTRRHLQKSRLVMNGTVDLFACLLAVQIRICSIHGLSGNSCMVWGRLELTSTDSHSSWLVILLCHSINIRGIGLQPPWLHLYCVKIQLPAAVTQHQHTWVKFPLLISTGHTRHPASSGSSAANLQIFSCARYL